MGTWDTKPFDNDHAADFASFVGACTDNEARTDMLMAAMKTILDDHYDPDGRLADEYEFPGEMENAIASAAFVADTRNNKRQFTDCSYAMVLDDSKDFTEDEAWSHIPFDSPPRSDLVETAGQTMEKILRLLEEAGISEEWQEGAKDVLAALKGDPGEMLDTRKEAARTRARGVANQMLAGLMPGSTGINVANEIADKILDAIWAKDA
jgi:hypothetical protein